MGAATRGKPTKPLWYVASPSPAGGTHKTRSGTRLSSNPRGPAGKTLSAWSLLMGVFKSLDQSVIETTESYKAARPLAISPSLNSLWLFQTLALLASESKRENWFLEFGIQSFLSCESP